jgi:hypothetical protein
MIIRLSLSKDNGLFLVPLGFNVIRWGLSSSDNM